MPAIIFDWNHDAFEIVIAQLQAVPAFVPLPVWIAAPNAAAITANSLKRDIVRVLAVQSGGSAGNSILAPHSPHQYRDVAWTVKTISRGSCYAILRQFFRCRRVPCHIV